LKCVPYFSKAAQRRSALHVCHAFHHDVTTKKPHQTPRFTQNPQKFRLTLA
jgi:hypothetical protein